MRQMDRFDRALPGVPGDDLCRGGEAWTAACAAFWVAAGGLLREHRELRGWSRHGLANRAGLTPETIARLEQGEQRWPVLEAWRCVADALDLDPILSVLGLVLCVDAAERRAMRLLHAELDAHSRQSLAVRYALHALADDLREHVRTQDRAGASAVVDVVDLTSRDSFPASDPPGWIGRH